MMRRFYLKLAQTIRDPRVGNLVKKGFSRANLTVYRLTGGRLWNKVNDGDIALLTTIGRASGRERVTPLVVVPHDDGWACVGSNAGGATHPAWVHNLRARPSAVLTIGAEPIDVHADEVHDEATYEAIYAKFVAANEGFATYRTATTRHLAVFRLTRESAHAVQPSPPTPRTEQTA